MADRKDAPTPTPPVVRLAAAEVDVVAARDRLSDTVARLQSRLDPKVLTQRAVEDAKTVGRDGADYARENPNVVGGAAAVVGLYLLRRPLARLFRRRKGPKPQKAARPMSATAPNERLARQAHPTAPPVLADAPVPNGRAPNGLDGMTALPDPHPTTSLPSDLLSNQGAHIKEPSA